MVIFFYGLPGTGKSSLIHALSEHYHRDIYYLELSKINNDQELDNLTNAINYSTSIVVMEDIDCSCDAVIQRKDKNTSSSIEQKENDESKSNLTLSGLLKFLDGSVQNTHGRIVIMTSNHPTTLDEALSRSGRIHIKYNFKFCDVDQIARLYKLFFSKDIDVETLKNKYNITDYKYSPALVSSVFQNYLDDPDKALKSLDENQTFDV